MENLSFICGGLGIIEEDDDDNHIAYTPGEYCLGFLFFSTFNFIYLSNMMNVIYD